MIESIKLSELTIEVESDIINDIVTEYNVVSLNVSVGRNHSRNNWRCDDIEIEVEPECVDSIVLGPNSFSYSSIDESIDEDDYSIVKTKDIKHFVSDQLKLNMEVKRLENLVSDYKERTGKLNLFLRLMFFHV